MALPLAVTYAKPTLQEHSTDRMETSVPALRPLISRHCRQIVTEVSSSMHQIWNAVAGDRPFLTKQQFYTAMRLVSAAQVQI